MGFGDTLKKVGRGALAVGTLGTSEAAIGAYKYLNPKAPGSPDFAGIAQQQTAANRPDQNTPYASTGWDKKAFDEPFPGAKAPIQEQIAWMARKQAYEANPETEQNTDFSGPLKGANDALMGQAAGNLSTPMDWAQFGQLGNGDEARQQAIDAAYGQATKRLDPMFAQRESAQSTQLSNQGLDPNSAAARAARAEMAANKNDAYGSAMNSAIMQGQATGDSVFRNNMQSRQQMIAEALGQRGQPLSEMQQMRGFLQMPGFAQADYMTPAIAQGGWDMNQWQADKQGRWDTVNGLVKLGTTAAGAA